MPIISRGIFFGAAKTLLEIHRNQLKSNICVRLRVCNPKPKLTLKRLKYKTLSIIVPLFDLTHTNPQKSEERRKKVCSRALVVWTSQNALKVCECAEPAMSGHLGAAQVSGCPETLIWKLKARGYKEHLLKSISQGCWRLGLRWMSFKHTHKTTPHLL